MHSYLFMNLYHKFFTGKYIVLTSHADTLQIMQTFLSNEDPRKFSQYRYVYIFMYIC